MPPPSWMVRVGREGKMAAHLQASKRLPNKKCMCLGGKKRSIELRLIQPGQLSSKMNDGSSIIGLQH